MAAALRVTLDGGTGVTQNVSASGMFFETDASYAPGSQIRFAVDLETPSGKMILTCHGDIVRVERREKRVGVAVRITESVIRPVATLAGAGPAT